MSLICFRLSYFRPVRNHAPSWRDNEFLYCVIKTHHRHMAQKISRGVQFNITMPPYQYRDFRDEDEILSDGHLMILRHQMEPFYMSLALCKRNPLVTGGFPFQRPAARKFNVFFGLHLNKQSRCQWFETRSRSLWCHCNVIFIMGVHVPRLVLHLCRGKFFVNGGYMQLLLSVEETFFASRQTMEIIFRVTWNDGSKQEHVKVLYVSSSRLSF